MPCRSYILPGSIEHAHAGKNGMQAAWRAGAAAGRAAPMPLRWRRGRGTNGMHVATAAAMLGALALMAAVRSLPGTGISVLPVAVGAVDHGGARASTGHTPALLIVNVTTAATARAGEAPPD